MAEHYHDDPKLKIAIFIVIIAPSTIAIAMCIYVFSHFKKIMGDVKNQIYIAFACVLIIICSFATIYICMMIYNGHSLRYTSGEYPKDWYLRALDMFYFSMVTFTSLGYGDILPNSSFAKIIVSIEALIFTVGISFVLLNFKGKQDIKETIQGEKTE